MIIIAAHGAHLSRTLLALLAPILGVGLLFLFFLGDIPAMSTPELERISDVRVRFPFYFWSIVIVVTIGIATNSATAWITALPGKMPTLYPIGAIIIILGFIVAALPLSQRALKVDVIYAVPAGGIMIYLLALDLIQFAKQRLQD